MLAQCRMLLMTSPKRVHQGRTAAKRIKSFNLTDKELVIVTGISGAGKASALRALKTWAFTRWTICRSNFCRSLLGW